MMSRARSVTMGRSNPQSKYVPPVQTSISAGGIKLVSGSHRITLNNTLDERLRLLEDRVSTICSYLP